MLAVCLAVVLLLSLFLVGAVYRRAARHEGASGPPLTRALQYRLRWYTMGVAGALMLALLYLIGTGNNGQGSAAFEEEQLSRVAHVGYYTGVVEDFSFGGQPGTDGFYHTAFGEGERLSLQAVTGPNNKPDSFRVAYEALSRPLRLNEQWANVPPGGWLGAEGGTLRIQQRLPSGEWRYHAVRWKPIPPEETDDGDLANHFYYTRGDLPESPDAGAPGDAGTPGDAGAPAAPAPGTESADTLVSEIVLEEGLALSTLLQISRDSTAEAVWEEVARSGNALVAAFEGTRFVRETKGRATSRLGVLVADTLLQRTDLRFFIDGQEIRPGATSGEVAIPAGGTIRYGLGRRRLFSLQTPAFQASRQGVGGVFWAPLEDGRSWSLPPRPRASFALISGGGEASGGDRQAGNPSRAVPLDGYRIGAVPPARSRYALASFEEDLDSLTVDDGRTERTVTRRDTFALGTAQSGVLLSLQPMRASASLPLPQGVPLAGALSSFPLPYAGWMAAVLVGLYAALHAFCVLPGTGTSRPRVETGWTLIWNLALTLLVVRLILAYRVSLLPPSNASPGELALFSKSLGISFAALVLFPPLLALIHRPRLLPGWMRPNWIRRLTKWGWLRRLSAKGAALSPGIKVTLAVAVLAVVFFLMFFLLGPADQTVAGLRANLTAYFVLVGAQAAAAGGLVMLGAGKRLGISVVVLGGLLAFVFATGDIGFLVLTLALLPVLALFLLFGRETSGWGAGLMLGGVVFVLALPWIATEVGQRATSTEMDVPGIDRVSIPGDALDDTFMRFPDPKEEVEAMLDRTYVRFANLSDREPGRLADMGPGLFDDYLGAEHQTWQMLLYAAEGVHHRPTGHAYGGTPLSDQALSYPIALTDCVFAVFLLAEHGPWAGSFLLGVYLLLGVSCLWVGGYFNPDTLHARLLPLAAVGAYFAYTALYMAGANIGATVFTGLNLPLLSLSSGSDLLFGLLALALVAYLTRAGLDKEPSGAFQFRSQKGTYWASVGFILGLLLLSAVTCWQIFNLGEDRLDDFSFEPSVFEPLVQSDGPNPLYRVRDRQIERRENTGEASPLLQRRIDDFNERPDALKDRPGGGSPIYLSGGNEIAWDASHYQLGSPFREARRGWQGTVTAASKDDPAWGGPAPTSLPLAVSQNSSGRLLLSPSDGTGLYLDGTQRDEPLLLSSLRAPKVVYTEDRQGASQWGNTIYLGRHSQPLLQTVWRNGRYESIYLRESTAPLSYGVKEAAQATAEASADTVQLSLDLDLHRRLQQVVSRFARENGYRSASELGGRRLAVSVTDAHTGEVRALAAWPFRNPQSRRFKQVVDSLGSGTTEENFLTNPNFQEHAIGSTFKPLLLTGVTAGLWDRLNTGRLTLRYTGKDTMLAGFKLSSDWDNRNDYQGTAGVRQFLRESNNAFLGKLGMLGTYIDKSEIWDTTMPPVRRDWKIRYQQTDDLLQRGFDLTQLEDSPFNAGAEETTIVPELMRQTVLFESLSRLYDVHFTSTPDSLWPDARARTFLPSLGTDSWKLQRVVPQPVAFDVQDYTSLRDDLVSFFLGSGDNYWTPVDMSAGVARAVTGRRVTPTLEPRDTLAPTFPESEGVLPPRSWRNAYLITPMEQVWSHSEGTMAALRSDIPEWIASAEEANAGSSYRVLMKTGTLDVDGNGPKGYSKMLVFMVGRWRGSDADGQFVPGQTVAGHFHMENVAAGSNRAARLRNAFARDVLPEVIEHVSELDAAQQAASDAS